MSAFRFTQAFPLAISLLCSSVGAETDLCYDTRINMTNSQRQGCREHQVIYRQSGFSGRAQLAQIISGVRCYGDNCPATYRYVLLLGSGDLVHIEDFEPWDNVIPSIRMWSALGLSSTIRASPEALYDRVVERVDGLYCHIYEMKAPLRGSLRDCVGKRAEPEGNVTYAEGTVRAPEASRLACAAAVSEATHKCWGLWTAVKRDSDQQLYYLATVAVSRDPGASAIVYDYLIYRVDALSSDAKLLERRPDRPNIRDFGVW